MALIKRDLIKYVRDAAKSAYTKDSKCYICGIQEQLELHHFVGLTELFNFWCARYGIKIDTVEDILYQRNVFIDCHNKELYEDVVTLCKLHHGKLHDVFGKAPVITSAKSQRKWVDIQCQKNLVPV